MTNAKSVIAVKIDDDQQLVPKLGCVYLWTLCRHDDSLEVKYVGMTRSNIFHRSRTHKFVIRYAADKNFEPVLSKKGHAIRELLLKKACISVWSRHSERREILDEPDVSLCATEEAALIKKFAPHWNDGGGL
ncbi:hypothetical protein [Microvirga sp. M2]|uniref:hypothetical protein n=1 Tax=Microvirga sp. M2 TaxID=3073270 RepID=UPI0039C42AB4